MGLETYMWNLESRMRRRNQDSGVSTTKSLSSNKIRSTKKLNFTRIEVNRGDLGNLLSSGHLSMKD